MNKCENCETRKFMAFEFDLHWMGMDDCPMACEEKERSNNGEQSKEA